MIEVYVIYKHPKDYPGKWVVRKQTVQGGQIVPSLSCIASTSLRKARSHVPKGFMRLDPMPEDDPVIAETWI